MRNSTIIGALLLLSPTVASAKEANVSLTNYVKTAEAICICRAIKINADGTVSARVETTVKGSPGKTVLLKGETGFCAIRGPVGRFMKPGHRYLVFVFKANVVGRLGGILPIEKKTLIARHIDGFTGTKFVKSRGLWMLPLRKALTQIEVILKKQKAATRKTSSVRQAKRGRIFFTAKDVAEGIRSVVFAPDAKSLVCGGVDGKVEVWDVAGGRKSKTFRGHRRYVNSVAICPNGKLVASAGCDNKDRGVIRIWSVRTGRSLTIEVPGREVTSVAFGPAGKLLASGDLDRTVRLWDATTRKPVATLKGHTGVVSAVAFSPDGKTLATAGHDATVRLWYVATRRVLKTLTGHVVAANCVAFSPDGKAVASGGGDQLILLWNTATGKLRMHYRSNGVINCLAFNPDGKVLASAGSAKTVELRDLASGEVRSVLKGHTRGITSIAFDAKGETLASAGWDGLRVWSLPADQ